MLSTDCVIDELGYTDSPTFFRESHFHEFPSLAQRLRLASRECGLQGVYALRSDSTSKTAIPVVYVCEANNRAEADRIHRLVWNQNVAPFLIVRTPNEVRLYSGFAYRTKDETSNSRSARVVLSESVSALEFASRVVPSFCANSIDSGRIWQTEGRYVRPEARVDWRLLKNLSALGSVLREKLGLPSRSAHALIGKYVYLRYLRDRGILSDNKLAEFDAKPGEIFGRNPKLKKLRHVIACLDEWLNGSVFDIPWDGTIRAEHVKEVAGAFFGDDPQTNQLNLFEAYDFAHIPIETLSVVYEQFLHAEGKGKAAGAYYTPIPLIDFVLDALEELHPLQPGMRVLDPACGSGAFLVQAYRRMIEKRLVQENRQVLRPTELREMLCSHFFGVDRDEDACQVTELSLILTLLDYVTPPDLSRSNGFKLPRLRNKNIFGGPQEDFFNTDSFFHHSAGANGFDWIVGNPPWTEIKPTTPKEESKYALDWKVRNQSECPTGGNQLAEFFCWKVGQHCNADEGVIGLLVPAMTLFKAESKRFRQEFFSKFRVESVVNFANLAYVLFAGRAEDPCAAIFYRHSRSEELPNDAILSYAPFVVNQEPNRSRKKRENLDTWSITVNGAELREVTAEEAQQGDALTWKLAMWGSYRDRKLLDRVQSKHKHSLNVQTMGQLGIVALEGPQLREGSTSDKLLHKPELVGKRCFPKNYRPFWHFHIPEEDFDRISVDRAYLRARGGEAPLTVCRPPHLLVSASRNYAIYSDEFFVIPPRQIGISGPPEQADFLKALSLYLVSDFAKYHQFLLAPQWGVRRNLANLDTLKLLPVPFLGNSAIIEELVRIHFTLVELERKMRGEQRMSPRRAIDKRQADLLSNNRDEEDQREACLAEMNDLIFECLDLRHEERVLVEDLVHVRLYANKGKVEPQIADPPTEDVIRTYCGELKDELNAFLEGSSTIRHEVAAYPEPVSGMGVVQVVQIDSDFEEIPRDMHTDSEGLATTLKAIKAKVREQRSQWLYFERNLRIYEEKTIYLFKPLQRIHWLRSQALLDADSILNDLLMQG